MSMKRANLSLIISLLVILVAFGLRTYRLDAFSFWTDEGLTPLRSGYDLGTILSNKVTIQAGTGNDTHPPFYFLLIHFTRRLFGESDFAYRYPSVLAGVLLVPLMFQIGRRMYGQRLGYVTAILTAVNPLQIWYAHEARMYTLVVLLVAASVYLLQQALTKKRWLAYLPPYLMIALLAFYTHYTAVFILALHSIFWIWLLWQHGYRKLLLGLGAIVLLAALPLVPYTIPRLFTGTEANYFYVPPLVMLKDVAHFFFLGLTTDFSHWWIQALVGGAAILLVIGFISIRNTHIQLLLATYLLATVVGLMIGSLIKPMYQGVRHIMVGSPAFMLLIAFSLVWLQQRRPSRFQLSATAVSLLVVLVGTAISLFNLYANPAYAKDDFRGLVRLMEQKAGSHDIIIYNNAIQLPLHQHYQQRSDIAITALPVYPYTATGNEPELAEYARLYDRIWFTIERPADGRDDNGNIENWLDSNLTHIDTFSSHARTTIVASKLYDTSPVFVNILSETAVIPTSNNLPNLLAWEQSQPNPMTGPAIWLNLYWQYPPPSETLTIQIMDLANQEWIRATYLPTPHSEQPQGAIIRQAYQVDLPAGLPPGNYTLNLFTESTSVTLGEVEFAASANWPLQPPKPDPTKRIYFSNGLSVDIIFADTIARPGGNLPLTLYWQTKSALPETLVFDLTVIDSNNEIIRKQTLPVGASWLTSLSNNSLYYQPTGLFFPPNTKNGDYRVTISLRQDTRIINGRPTFRPWNTATNTIEEITILSWPLVTQPPANVTTVDALLDNTIRLYGFTIDNLTNDSVTLTLTWEALSTPSANWFAFIHLTDQQGNIVRQHDRVPVNGLRPTTGWRTGEFLTDSYTFNNLSELPPGEYQVYTGMFDPITFFRPPLSVAGERIPNDQYPLTTLTLP